MKTTGCRLQYLLIPVLIVLCLDLASAAIDVNVTDPAGDGNYLVGIQAIVFILRSDDTNTMLVDINYSSSSTQGTGTAIIDDENTDGAAITCDDANANNTTCSYAWNTTAVTDANYYILIDVNDGIGNTDFNASAIGSFAVSNISDPVVVDPDGDGNYLAGTQLITFTVFDYNVTGNDVGDFNALIYYSSTQGAFTNLITDLNLFDANACTCPTCDDNKDFSTEKTCRYAWDTSGVTDANYFMDINVVHYSLHDLYLDSNSDSSDLNFAVDNTSATPTITNPPLGYETVGAPKFYLTYTCDEPNIKKYWVGIKASGAATAWYNNSKNTSYTFTVSSEASNTYVLYVIVETLSDQNSSTASRTVRFSTGGITHRCGDGSCTGNETAATCPEDCPAICGDGACTHNESVTNCPQDCGPAVVCGDGACEGDETYLNCPQDCPAPPPECTTDEDCEAGYECEDGQCVAKPPPPECTVDGDCAAGYECVNQKCVEKPPPPVECTVDADCDDANPCTSDVCAEGECSFIPVADGTTCGYEKECEAGVCKEIGAPPIIPPIAGIGLGTIAIAVIIIAAIIGIVYYYFLMPKK